MGGFIHILNISFSSSLAVAGVAFFSSLTLSLILVPLCRRLALRLDFLDRPGGRKEHERATPLLGGLAVALACGLGLVAVLAYQGLFSSETDLDIPTDPFKLIFMGSVIIFATGLIDDLFGDNMPFYYKLVGQIIGSSVAMAVVFFAYFKRLIDEDVGVADYLYLVVHLSWMLTVINSFNFSDNMNGLSSGLAVIALLISMVYLGSMFNIPFIILGFILVGAILGFMPFNFPKARIFLGDAGSMFIGYWLAIILWPLTKGFFSAEEPLFGLDKLIPPILVMGVPLYDAAFVVFMRAKEGRPSTWATTTISATGWCDAALRPRKRP